MHAVKSGFSQDLRIVLEHTSCQNINAAGLRLPSCQTGMPFAASVSIAALQTQWSAGPAAANAHRKLNSGSRCSMRVSRMGWASRAMIITVFFHDMMHQSKERHPASAPLCASCAFRRMAIAENSACGRRPFSAKLGFSGGARKNRSTVAWRRTALLGSDKWLKMGFSTCRSKQQCMKCPSVRKVWKVMESLKSSVRIMAS